MVFAGTLDDTSTHIEYLLFVHTSRIEEEGLPTVCKIVVR